MKILRAFPLLIVLAGAPGWASDTKATDNVAKAQEARERGDFTGSLPFWRAAAEAYAADKDSSGQLSAALGLADAFQQLGQYRLAETTLETADQVARKGGDKRLQVRVESSLGAVYMLTSNPDDAEGLLTKSLALAREVGDAHLIATALNNLANLQAYQKSRTTR